MPKSYLEWIELGKARGLDEVEADRWARAQLKRQRTLNPDQQPSLLDPPEKPSSQQTDNVDWGGFGE